MAGANRTRCILAYDVTDDGTRAKLAEMLLDYGERVQKSVFEADLTGEDMKEILTRASKLIDKDDSFRIYRLCRSCSGKAEFLGPGRRMNSASHRII